MLRPLQLLCALLAAMMIGNCALASDIYRLDWHGPYDKSDYIFLTKLLDGKSVVQLGESIHMTDEFPRVRLQLIRYMHEELGFDVLAFEGSWLQAWLAEDVLYHCDDANCIPEAQRLAWFSLWQTDAMRSVMEYVAATQKTAHPLYLASFDIQTGADAKFEGSGAAALTALFTVLKKYPAQRDSQVLDGWKQALTPFFGCYPAAPQHSDTERQSALAALSGLRGWIEKTAPAVQPPAHARALLSLPEALERSVELCSVTPTAALGGTANTYQQFRDQLNAENVIALRDKISETHRIILWAHHSHVRQNWSTRMPSMGQRLQEMIGRQLYTVGVFAGNGEAIAVDDQANPPLALRKLHPSSEFELENALSKLADYDFLFEFPPPDKESPWLTVMSTRGEAEGTAHLIPAETFSAAIFVHTIHAPEPFASSLKVPLQY